MFKIYMQSEIEEMRNKIDELSKENKELKKENSKLKEVEVVGRGVQEHLGNISKIMNGSPIGVIADLERICERMHEPEISIKALKKLEIKIIEHLSTLKITLEVSEQYTGNEYFYTLGGQKVRENTRIATIDNEETFFEDVEYAIFLAEIMIKKCQVLITIKEGGNDKEKCFKNHKLSPVETNVRSVDDIHSLLLMENARDFCEEWIAEKEKNK